MAQEYFAIPTKIGNEKLLRQKLDITHFAVGDSGGEKYKPTEEMTQLKNEKWRGIVTRVLVPNGTTEIMIESFISAEIGGFVITEMAAFDVDGDMVAIAVTAPVSKPTPESGNAIDIAPKIRLILASVENIVIKVDSTDKAYVDYALGIHNNDSDVHPSKVTGTGSIFYTLEELTLSKNATPEQIHGALPEKSTLVLRLNNDNELSGIPIKDGLLVATKVSPTETFFEICPIAGSLKYSARYLAGVMSKWSFTQYYKSRGSDYDGLINNSNFYVDPVNGNDTNEGLVDTPFKTLEYATQYICHSVNRDLKNINLMLKSGTYTVNGDLFLNNLSASINMLAENAEDKPKIIIKNGGLKIGRCPYRVYIRDIDFIGEHSTSLPLILIHDISNVLIARCSFSSSTPEFTDGIRLEQASSVLVNNSTFSQLRYCALSCNASYLGLSHNTGTGNACYMYANNALISRSGTKPEFITESVIAAGGQIF